MNIGGLRRKPPPMEHSGILLSPSPLIGLRIEQCNDVGRNGRGQNDIDRNDLSVLKHTKSIKVHKTGSSKSVFCDLPKSSIAEPRDLHDKGNKGDIGGEGAKELEARTNVGSNFGAVNNFEPRINVQLEDIVGDIVHSDQAAHSDKITYSGNNHHNIRSETPYNQSNFTATASDKITFDYSQSPRHFDATVTHNIENFGYFQLFWKFHIERFDPNFYLSTAPTSRHVKCRSAPGYFVRVLRDVEATREYSATTLLFEDIVSGMPIIKVKCDSQSLKCEVLVHRMIQNGELITVTKGSESPNLKPSYSTNRSIRRKPPKFDSVTSKTESAPPEASNFKLISRPSSRCFNNNIDFLALRKPIETKFLPEFIGHQQKLINYETTVSTGKYFVGTIPQAREYHLNFSDDTHSSKFIRKRQVYFHQEFTDPNTCFSDISLALVVAVFRPCETTTKKRILRKLHRISGNASEIGNLWSDWTDLDWQRHKQISSSLEWKEQQSELKAALPKVKPYSQAGDGLNFDKNPIDDEPNHIHKYGWLTVYDRKLFGASGVFDVVVALTMAASLQAEKL